MAGFGHGAGGGVSAVGLDRNLVFIGRLGESHGGQTSQPQPPTTRKDHELRQRQRNKPILLRRREGSRGYALRRVSNTSGELPPAPQAPAHEQGERLGVQVRTVSATTVRTDVYGRTGSGRLLQQRK